MTSLSQTSSLTPSFLLSVVLPLCWSFTPSSLVRIYRILDLYENLHTCLEGRLLVTELLVPHFATFLLSNNKLSQAKWLWVFKAHFFSRKASLLATSFLLCLPTFSSHLWSGRSHLCRARPTSLGPLLIISREACTFIYPSVRFNSKPSACRSSTTWKHLYCLITTWWSMAPNSTQLRDTFRPITPSVSNLKQLCWNFKDEYGLITNKMARGKPEKTTCRCRPNKRCDEPQIGCQEQTERVLEEVRY